MNRDFVPSPVDDAPCDTSWFSIVRLRSPLSSLRVPSTTTASPYSLTFSRMKRSAFLIFRRSVHQRNTRLGAGYPLPSRHTQNVSSSTGRTRLVDTGSPDFSAAPSIMRSVSVMRSTIFGDSTSVSDDMTYTRFASLPGGSPCSAVHTICTMHVLSLPPEYPSIHGRSSARYAARTSPYMSSIVSRAKTERPCAPERPAGAPPSTATVFLPAANASNAAI